MGGLVALLLASERLADGLVVVGVPLRLRGAVPWLVPALKRLVPVVDKKGGSDILDEAARRRHPSYPRMPLQAVHELTKLQRVVRGRLPQVAAPILVAHGARDRTADPRDARALYDRVSSPERRLLLLPDSAHVVPVDREGPALARAAAEFLLSACRRQR
jgi:carboxylesterase